MKIGIDARMLDSAFGLGRYIQQLITHLIPLCAEHELVLFLRTKEQLEQNRGHLGELPPHVRVVYADIPWYGWKEQVQFPKQLQKERLDLMHFPHWNVPLLYRGPFVVTIHDLTMFHFPRPEATTLGPFVFWLKDKLSRWIIRSAAKRAEHIITTTEFTKEDVHTHLGVRRDRMTTMYQAPFTSQKQAAIAQEETSVVQPYIMYVGAAYPHKNLEGLLRAWNEYTKNHDDGMHLVLAGKNNYFYERLCGSDLFTQAQRVSYLGEVSDTQLHALYANATAYVFPSLYEGFGLPPLEAMVYDVPVLSSNRSCLPEILGEAALYVDPENTQQFATAIHTIVTNGDMRHTLQEKGREQIKIYSWERLAQQTYQLYKRCLS